MSQHLVFQTAFPGDLFLSVPLIKRIKEWDPDARVALACRPGLGDFFLQTGLVDEVVVINKRNKKQMREAMRLLRAQEWDVIFAPHESVRTALLMWRLRARHKVSFAQWWNALVYDRRVQKPVDYPDALRQLSLLTPLDGRLAELFGQEEVGQLRNDSSAAELVDFRALPIPEWASMRIMGLKPQGRVVFVAPGSTWNTKRWTARGYAELIRSLRRENFDVVLVGSPAERALCDEIAVAVGDSAVVNRAGQTSLAELAQLLRTGMALFTNDSGAMHAAAVSGLPTVAVFGPTVLSLGFRPWNEQAMVVQLNLDCRPCGKHGHDSCPLGHHHCMEKIGAARVMSAFKALLP